MQVSIGTMSMPFDDRKEHTDGRKTLFHTAVYLLPLEDLRAAMTALTARPELAEQTPKERALAAVGLLQDAADRRGISLKLNRKPCCGGFRGICPFSLHKRIAMRNEIMEIRLAQARDIHGWMALVEQVKDSFPGLETAEALAEHRETVLRFIRDSSAICAAENGRVVGTLLFSRESSMLCFLAVHPSCRRQHIARQMVNFMLTQMEDGKAITVTTYQADDPRGAAARAFYKRMGFSEGRLTEEFGCPVQEFLLKR